jgi:uncharacterized protein YbjT (DUF2867 family)
MRVLVTAANGRTGRAIIGALRRAGAEPRAFIRDDAQWPALEALGAADYARGDLLDPRSLAPALEGCEALIYIGPPMHPNEREMATAALGAAAEARLAAFVYYSVMHPLRREVRHHRLKLEVEEQVVESGLPYTILQPMRYMQHLEPLWKQVSTEGVHAMPFNTRVKFNVVDLEDLARATAIVTLDATHRYATYELAGPEALSQEDMARIISEVTGRAVSAAEVPIETLERRARAAGASADRIEQMTIMNRHYDRYGFLGNPKVLEMVLGREPTRFRDYVKRLSP